MTLTKPSPGVNAARRTLVSSVGVTTAAAMPVFLTGALAVQIRAELGYAEPGQGLVVAAYFGTAAVFSTPAGRVVERIGPARALRLSASLSCLSLLAIATVARSLVTLLVCVAVGGLGNSLAHPSSNLQLVRQLPAKRLGFGLGFKQAAIPIATLLGGLAVPTIALTVGWRWAYVAASIGASLLAYLDPDGGFPPLRTAAPARRGPLDASIRPLILLAVGGGLASGAAGTLGSFLISGLVDRGMGEGAAGGLAALCGAICVVTRIGSGVAADRWTLRHLRIVAGMATAGAIGFGLIALGTTPLVVVGAVLAYGLGWGWPGLFNLAIVRNNTIAPAAATGITQSGVYVGAVSGPLIFGAVVDDVGYPAAWLGAGTAALVGALTVLAGRKLLLADRERRSQSPDVSFSEAG